MSGDDAHIASVILNYLHMSGCTSRKCSELGGHAYHAQKVIGGLVDRQAIQLLGLLGLVPGIDLDTVLYDEDDLVSGKADSTNRGLRGDESHCLVLHRIPDDDLNRAA